MTGAMPLERRLIAGANDLGLTLTAQQCAQLLQYIDLLDRWSAIYNLSAIRGPEAILRQHILDCLAAVPSMIRWAAGRAIRVLDVGSGAGLPGLVVAVVKSDWSVTTIDAVAKKAAFVRQAAGELGLANLNAVHGRVESLPAHPGFDLITCRALATVGEFTMSSAHCLREHGIWVAMKGVFPTTELAGLRSGITVFHVEPLHVPGLDAARCLVWIRPN